MHAGRPHRHVVYGYHMSISNVCENLQLAQLCCDKQGAGRMHGQADGHLVIDMKLGGCGSRLLIAMAFADSHLPHVFARTRTGTAPSQNSICLVCPVPGSSVRVCKCIQGWASGIMKI